MLEIVIRMTAEDGKGTPIQRILSVLPPNDRLTYHSALSSHSQKHQRKRRMEVIVRGPFFVPCQGVAIT